MRIGQEFRYEEEGRVYNVIMIYNRLDEEHPYTLVNTENWEVVDSFAYTKDIKPFDVLKELAKRLVVHDGDSLSYKIGIDHYFCLMNESIEDGMLGREIFNHKLSTQEKEKAEILCSIYGVPRVFGNK